MTDPLWISLELDPGAAAFFGLPARLLVPEDPEHPILGGYDPQVSFPNLARGLERALELQPGIAGYAEIMRFVRRWPRYADLDRYLQMGNGTFARTVARGLLTEDPGDPPPLAALALLEAQEGRWDAALDLWERLRERAPTHAPARLQAALCLAGSGRRDEALEEIRILSRRSRVEPLARLWRYELARDEDDAARAARIGNAMSRLFGVAPREDDENWEALEAAFPGNPEVTYARAVDPVRTPKDEEREELLERVLEGDPHHLPARVALAGLRRRHGRAAEGLAVLQSEDAGEPEAPALRAGRGQCLEQLGRRDEALAAYRAVFEGPLAHLPGAVLLVAGQGLLRLAGGEESRKLLEDTVQARPGDPLPHQMLARLDEAAGGDDAAEHRLRNAIRTCGPLPTLEYALGDLLRRRGRKVEAEGLFKVLARRHPASPWGHRGLGDLVVEVQPVLALEHYARALGRDPTVPIPGYDYLRGVAALRAGDLEEAGKRLRRAVANEPDNPRFWCDLGAVYFYSGRLEPALGATRRALELRPGHPGFLHNLAAYHRARFRRNPIRHAGSLWRSWRLGRQLAGADPTGWKRDLWKPEDEPREAPPPGAPPSAGNPT